MKQRTLSPIFLIRYNGMAFPARVCSGILPERRERTRQKSNTQRKKYQSGESVYWGINPDRNETESMKWEKKVARLGREQLQQKSASPSAQVVVALGWLTAAVVSCFYSWEFLAVRKFPETRPNDGLDRGFRIERKKKPNRHALIEPRVWVRNRPFLLASIQNRLAGERKKKSLVIIDFFMSDFNVRWLEWKFIASEFSFHPCWQILWQSGWITG